MTPQKVRLPLSSGKSFRQWTSFLDCSYPMEVLHRGFPISGEDGGGHIEGQNKETYPPKKQFVPKFPLRI